MTAPAIPAPTGAAPSTAPAPASSPLAAAIAAAGDALEATQAATLDPAPTPTAPDTPAGEPSASADAAPPTPDAADTATDTDATPDAGTEPTLYDVELPLPNADGSKGPRGTGALKMQFESQEAADTMRHWVKQGLKAKELEATVAQLDDARAALTLAQEQPDTFLHMVTANRPEAAQSFVKTWMQANPDSAIQLFGTLGFGEKSEEVLRLEGRLAAQEAAERIRTGTQTVQTRQTEERFVARAKSTITDLASQIGLTPESAAFKAFASSCAEVLDEQVKRSPALLTGQTDLALLLQEQVREWQEIQQARKAKVVRATTAPRDAAGQFAAKAEKDARLRKQSPGATPLAPLSVEKVTGTNDVMDIIRALKH